MMSQMEVLSFNNVLREALLRKRCAKTFFFFFLSSLISVHKYTHVCCQKWTTERFGAFFFLYVLFVLLQVSEPTDVLRELFLFLLFFSFLIVALYIQGSLNFCNSHVCINTQNTHTHTHTQLITPLVMLTSLVALVTADRCMFRRNKKKRELSRRDTVQ